MSTFGSYVQALVNGGNFTVQIASGDSISTTLALTCSLVGIRTPANFTACTLYIYTSLTGLQSTFLPLSDPATGLDIGILANPSQQAVLLPAVYVGACIVQVHCSVAQASDVSLELVCGPALTKQ
jgi:hypothetical protein